MKSRRREARELAMKILFQVEVGHRPLEEVMETTTEAVPIPEEEREYVDEVVRGVLARQAELDQVIGDLASGWKLERIFWMWAGIVLVSGLSSLAGYRLFQGASPDVVAFVLTFAAGAILTMLSDTMMPEAHEHGGRWVGVVTTLGFILAFAIHQLD